MSMNRRDFIRSNAVAAAAGAAGAQVLIPIHAVAAPKAESAPAAGAATGGDIKWDKGVCRFCGTGCAVLVGVQNGRVVATQGDPDSAVNRGLNCIKGYFNGRILYGQDRLTRPLMRMKDGAFDKRGDFVPVSWDRAMDEMERQAKRALAQKGPTGIAMILVPIAFNLIFFALGSAFDYPDILREPAGTILRRFDDGGAELVALWYAFAFTALLAVPLALLLYGVFAREQPHLALAAAIAWSRSASVGC